MTVDLDKQLVAVGWDPKQAVNGLLAANSVAGGTTSTKGARYLDIAKSLDFIIEED